MNTYKKQLPTAALGLLLIGITAVNAYSQGGYLETDLVSDIPNRALHTDPNLVNPWGISESPTGAFWVSDNGSDLSTLYNTPGVTQGLVVSIPNGAPTGTVFNSTTGFNHDLFLFASESGFITGWRGALGTSAEVLADLSSAGAVFKGLAIGATGGNTYVYATDFHNNKIDVWKGDSGAPSITGSFTDPTVPAGYAPFNIQNIKGLLYVTYALQDDDAHDDVAGAGHGFVDVYTLNGDLMTRLVSGGALDSPWGVALAPANFGNLSGDLLVGNFGDGEINAYDPSNGTWAGSLDDSSGSPLIIQGLWALQFGNGGNGGDLNSLYFTAGIAGDGEVEDHGLFGRITPVPESSTVYGGIALVLFSGFAFWRRRRANAVEVIQ